MPEKTGFWAQFFSAEKSKTAEYPKSPSRLRGGFRQNAFLQKIAVWALAIAEKMIYNYVVKLRRGGARLWIKGT